MKKRTLNEHLKTSPLTRGISIRFKFKNGKKAESNQNFRVIELWVDGKKKETEALTAAQSKSKRSRADAIKRSILAGISLLPKKKPTKKTLAKKKAAPKKPAKKKAEKKPAKKTPPKKLPPKKKPVVKKKFEEESTVFKLFDPSKVPTKLAKDLKLVDDPTGTETKTIFSLNLDKKLRLFKKRYQLSAPFQWSNHTPQDQMKKLSELVMKQALDFQKLNKARGKKEFLLRFSHTEKLLGKAPRLSGWGLPRMHIGNATEMRRAIELLLKDYLRDIETYLKGYRTIAVTAFNIEAGD